MPHLSAVRPALSWRELLTVAREDYTVAVLLLGTLIAAVWLMPFAIYRALQGNWWAMSNDVALSALFVWAGHRAWRTGDTRLSGWVVACATVGGIWAIGWAARFAALFWVYPGVLMLFFLVPPRAAVLLAALAIGGSAYLSHADLGGGEGLPFFLFTALLTALLGYMTSQQAQHRIARWQSLSLIDALTGVANRRLMEIELDRASSGGGPIGLLAVLDLDHFKSINDRFGHDAGDLVLRDFAATVQSRLRRGDRFYRLGGEEFVLWLPDVGRAQAEAVLERLREQIREHVRAGEGEAVTVSMGVAAHHAGEHWRDCLARADQALYRAKSAGRNRVEWAEGDAIECSISLVERRA
jgi:diguanylate cyclase (GGDEF)-like protein